MKMQKGFTLIELMIVVVIISVLSSIALPAYNDYVIRGRLVDGTAALAEARIRMEQWFQDNRTYANGPCPVPTQNFTYNCGAPTAAAYIITAQGTGAVSNFSYSIDQTNTKRTVSMKPGWGTTGTCWITTKGGTC